MNTTIYNSRTSNIPESNPALKQELLPCSPFAVPQIRLSYINPVKSKDRQSIKGAEDAYRLLYQTWDREKIEMQEQFKVLLLNRANHVLGIYELSTGGVAGTIADPKLIFAAAIKANASSIITAHNHPSGNLLPSATDKALTCKIKEAGRLLEIVMLDHIIVTPYGYYSFVGEGLI
jgi:DNA repair protein RadC